MGKFKIKRMLALFLAGALMVEEPAVINVFAQETTGQTPGEAEIPDQEESKILLEYDGEVVMNWGDTSTLSFTAESTSGKPLTYQWYYYDYNASVTQEMGWAEIEGAIEETYSVTADNALESQKYKCVVSDGSASGEAYYTLNVYTGLALTYEGMMKVGYGDTVVLKVEAESLSGGPYTYQWRTGGEEIEGATGNTYSVIADENMKTWYSCMVSDGFSSEWADIEIELDTGLSLDYKKRNSVAYGDAVTLEVEAESGMGKALTYQWFCYNDEGGWEENGEIKGATESTYVIPKCDEDAHLQYVCEVSDGIVRKYAFMDVVLDTGFTVNSESWNEFLIRTGGTAVLEVDAHSSLGRTITYEWFGYYEEGDWSESSRKLEGITGSTCSVTADENMAERYECVVSDGINYEYVHFAPQIDIGFVMEEYESIEADYGEMITMKADVENTWGAPTAYKWYYFDTDTYEYIEIEGETAGSYSVKADENAAAVGHYKCAASNELGSRKKNFSLTIDSGLTVEYGKEKVVREGERAVLEVKGKSAIGRNITYQWYQPGWEGEYEAIEGETNSTYTVPEEMTRDRLYECWISDGVSTICAGILFRIGTITVEYEHPRVPYGEMAALEVKAESLIGKELTYQWSYYDEDRESYKDIVGANSSVYSIKADENMLDVYRCVIEDIDKSDKREIYLHPQIIRSLTFFLEYEGNLAVQSGKMADMKVNVKDSGGDKAYTYQWYYQDKQTGKYVAITGAAGDTYSVKADENAALKYRCVVSNSLGSRNADFSLTVTPKVRVDIKKECTAELSFASAEFTGKAIVPKVTVRQGTLQLKEGTDYTVSYTGNINVGTAKVTITGTGDYTGTIEKSFTITQKEDNLEVKLQPIEKAVVTLAKTTCAYNGKKQEPSVKSVKLDDTILKEGTDYTVSYENNKNIGKAAVVITGKGKYTGTVKKQFAISAKKGTVLIVDAYKYKITSAAETAFAGLKDDKTAKVKIPKTVKIGGKAFKVTSISDKALQNKKVTSVTIGENVTTIGKEAFKNCKKLGTVTIQSAKLKKVGKNTFKGIKATAKIKVPSKKLKEYKKLLKGKGQGRKVQIKK